MARIHAMGQPENESERQAMRLMAQRLPEVYVIFASVSKVEMALLHRPSKGISVDKQANDDGVHLRRFGKADGLAP